MEKYQHLADRLSHYLGIFIAGLVLAEALLLYLLYRKTYRKELLVNLLTGGVSFFTVGLFKASVFAWLFLKVYECRIFTPGFHWYSWVACFFAYTAYDYFSHVLYHRVRLFWCFHSVHHTVQQMNSSAGFRASVLDVFSVNVLLLLLPLLGIHPLMYFVQYTLHKFWGMIIHVNERLVGKFGWLDYLLVSPSSHHLHHASNAPYIDKNYGELVPWYDMVFGTYVRETEKPVYGTVLVQTELNFTDSQFFEFRRLRADLKKAKSWREKAGYLLKPPGWAPAKNG